MHWRLWEWRGILTSASTGEVWADARDLEEMLPMEGYTVSCPGGKGGEGIERTASVGHRGIESAHRELWAAWHWISMKYEAT